MVHLFWPRSINHKIINLSSLPFCTGSMDHTPAIDKYAVRLKKVYSNYIFEMTDEWPPGVSDQYINLALINHKKIIRPDERDEFAKSTLHGTVDDLYFEKRVDHPRASLQA